MRDLTPSAFQRRGRVIEMVRVLASLFEPNGETRRRFDRLLRMRDHVLHGIETPNADDLREAAQEPEAILEQLLTGF